MHKNPESLGGHMVNDIISGAGMMGPPLNCDSIMSWFNNYDHCM